jgi:hypothetical protein
MDPVLQMMSLAPGRGAGTVGEDPAGVADGQGDSLGGLDDSAGPAERQGWVGALARTGGSRVAAARSQVATPPRSWPSVAAVVAGVVVVGVVVGAGGLAGDQDPGDRAVTGQPATRLRCQRSGVGVAARGPRGARAGCPGPR